MTTLQNKCKHYDKGYCMFKEKCNYYHPSINCTDNCDNKRQCQKRHRLKCKYGKGCYFLKNNICEYNHENQESTDVTLASNDGDSIQAHKVIMAEYKDSYDKETEKV